MLDDIENVQQRIKYETMLNKLSWATVLLTALGFSNGSRKHRLCSCIEQDQLLDHMVAIENSSRKKALQVEKYETTMAKLWPLLKVILQQKIKQLYLTNHLLN